MMLNVLKRMDSVGFNRICYGFNSFQLRSGIPLSICLTPELDPPPNEQIFFPIQPLRHLFRPSYATPAVRDEHPPSRCTSPGPSWSQGWPQAFPPQGHCSQHVPAPVFIAAGVFRGAPRGCPQRGCHHRWWWLWIAALKHYKPHYRIITGSI